MLSAILHKKHYCQRSGALELNETLLGIPRYRKVSMFLWLSGGREAEKHYIRKDWPAKENFLRGKLRKTIA